MTVSTATYQEELYRIPSRVLIVLSREWKEISEDDKVLLTKILGSVKLKLAHVTIVTRSNLTMEEMVRNGSSKIISFGVTIDNFGEQYKNLPFENGSVIIAEDFPKLDDAKKKSLWQALRQMFGI